MNIQTAADHPCLKHPEISAQVAMPLQEHGIGFFGFTALDNKNNAFCFGSKPAYAEEYLRQNFVTDDAHYRPEFSRGQYHYYFWDFVKLSPQAKRLYQLAAQFDQSHTMTIMRFDKDMTRCYHFSGHVADTSINERYLSRLDVFHSYIDYFDDCLINQPEIADIFNHPTNLQQPKPLNDGPVKVITDDPKKLILSDIANAELRFKHSSRYYLSKNERICLFWLYRGKSADMIAKILNVSRKTIERHISSAKFKYDCYTQFQLGQKTTEAGLSTILGRHTNI